MHIGYLISGTVLLLLSVSCIVWTVVEMASRKFGMGTLDFWGAVVFHAVSGMAAAFLLYKAHQGKGEQT